MLRRVKAALVTGVLWALVWIPVGVGVGLYQYWTGSFIDVAPTPARMVAFILMRFALGWGLMGAISGALFAFTLAVAERGRTVATISVGRVAVWGAVATLILPFISFLVLLLMFGSHGMYIQFIPMESVLALGAGGGGTMLWLGRRAPESATDGASPT